MSKRGAKAVAVEIETGDMIVEMRIDDPTTSWSQFLYEIENGLAHPGKRTALVNKRELMGGFCRFHGTQVQEEAMRQFKALYERSLVGGAKAVDPSREVVDGGGINPHLTAMTGAAARARFGALRAHLTEPVFKCVEFVVMGDHGPTSYARWRYRERVPGGSLVGKGSVEMRAFADRIAVFLNLSNERVA